MSAEAISALSFTCSAFGPHEKEFRPNPTYSFAIATPTCTPGLSVLLQLILLKTHERTCFRHGPVEDFPRPWIGVLPVRLVSRFWEKLSLYDAGVPRATIPTTVSLMSGACHTNTAYNGCPQKLNPSSNNGYGSTVTANCCPPSAALLMTLF